MSVLSEIAVIGSCLASPEATAYATAVLKPEHFKNRKLALIFSRIAELHADNMPIDVVTVYDTMTTADQTNVERAFILDVSAQVPTALHIPHYAIQVKRDYYGRVLTTLYEKAGADVRDPDVRDEIKSVWIQMCSENRTVTDLDNGLIRFTELIDARAKGIAKVEGAMTGLGGFDSLSRGMMAGKLITIGARTSRGKTTYMLSLARRLILRNYRTLFMTTEMDATELIERLVSAQSKVPLFDLRGMSSQRHMARIVSSMGELHKKPLTISDVPRLTLDAVMQDIENHRPQIVFVDYIQRFTVPKEYRNARAAFFSDVANELKAIAREKQITIITASQLGRDTDYTDREPVLADLKESGGIEEASDIVMFLHSRIADRALPATPYEFIFAKNRGGPLGRIPGVFFKDTACFEEQEPEEMPEDRLPGT